MINQLTFTTRFGKDGELKYAGQGTAVLSVRCPVECGWGDNKHTSWVSCAIFGKRAEALEPHIKKGGQATITGALKVREYEHNGEQRTAVDVLVNDIELQGGQSSSDETSKQPPSGGPGPETGDGDDFEDSIPFIHRNSVL